MDNRFESKIRMLLTSMGPTKAQELRNALRLQLNLLDYDLNNSTLFREAYDKSIIALKRKGHIISVSRGLYKITDTGIQVTYTELPKDPDYKEAIIERLSLMGPQKMEELVSYIVNNKFLLYGPSANIDAETEYFVNVGIMRDLSELIEKNKIKKEEDNLYTVCGENSYHILKKENSSPINDLEQALNELSQSLDDLTRSLGAKPSNGNLIQNDENSNKYITEEIKTAKKREELSIQQSSIAKEELNALIGLSPVKSEVAAMSEFVKIQRLRQQKGMRSVPISLHLVFTGNPGTGKTTIARILAKLYKEIGILEKGQLVEVERADLVAGYVGQTAIKTQAKIQEAMGGVLFIDEAYTLAKEGNDFGQEAIDTILKAMEDKRDKFVVIVAGYREKMAAFINSNPGLKSRFSKYIDFPDYSASELQQILVSMCKQYEYHLEDKAKIKAFKFIDHIVETKNENFANAREIRNFFEKVITRQALRVGAISYPSQDQLTLITEEDIDGGTC